MNWIEKYGYMRNYKIKYIYSKYCGPTVLGTPQLHSFGIIINKLNNTIRLASISGVLMTAIFYLTERVVSLYVIAVILNII